jgi:hypothetical protein
LIVRDLRGDVIPLVFNAFSPKLVVDPDPALPKGSITAIREPLVDGKTWQFPGVPAILVGSLTDMVRLDPFVDAHVLDALAHENWIVECSQSPDELRGLGNAALQAGDSNSR